MAMTERQRKKGKATHQSLETWFEGAIVLKQYHSCTPSGALQQAAPTGKCSKHRSVSTMPHAPGEGGCSLTASPG